MTMVTVMEEKVPQNMELPQEAITNMAPKLITMALTTTTHTIVRSLQKFILTDLCWLLKQALSARTKLAWGPHPNTTLMRTVTTKCR